MAYDWNDNPLKNVKVDVPEFCKDRNHLGGLLIRGYCPSCLRTISLPNDDTKVFERLENIKKLGV
jgi:hypothetical protein